MKKLLFEIKRYNKQNVIFIDNNIFDWEIDPKAIEKIKLIKNEQEIKKIKINIKNYFISCLSNFINKNCSIKEVIDSIESGYILLENPSISEEYDEENYWKMFMELQLYNLHELN